MAKVSQELLKVIGNETDPAKIVEMVRKYDEQKALERERLAGKKRVIQSLKVNDRKVSPELLVELCYDYVVASKQVAAFGSWLVTERNDLYQKRTKTKTADKADNDSVSQDNVNA